VIDSHCHLQLCREPLEDILSRAGGAGLTDLIQVATDSETSVWGRNLAQKCRDGVRVHPTIGLYPSRAQGDWESQMETLEQELASRAYVALGEMGIDLYHDQSYLDRQLEMFHAQVPLALKYDLPMILHIRKSYEQVRDALSDYKGEKALRGVWHCFEGRIDEALHFVGMGWRVSFSGLLTYQQREDLRKVAQELPLQSLMVETDSPYLSPVPLRHEKNEPWKVCHVLNCLAEIRGVEPKEMEAILDHNTRQFFGLKPPQGIGRGT